MDKELLKSKWPQLKGKVKQKWSKLTDADIARMSGTWDELLAKLQEVYSWKAEEAEKELKQFLVAQASTSKEKETAKW